MGKWNRPKLARRLVAGASFMAIVFMLFGWFEKKQVYHPSRPHEIGPEEIGRPFEDIHLITKDRVKIHGWFFRCRTNESARAAVLVCHGNGGNISHRGALYQVWLEAGCDVLAFDYRGYGSSEGSPSEEGTYRDGQAAYGWLEARGYSRIILHGESLGGGVAAELALREKPAGLVLHSSFTSIPDVGGEIFPWLPVRWLSRIRYDTVSKLPKVTAPLLILHSRRDSMIRFAHAQRNFESARGEKTLVEIAGDHNDGISVPAVWIKLFREFAGKL